MSNYVEWEMQGLEFANCNCACSTDRPLTAIAAP